MTHVAIIAVRDAVSVFRLLAMMACLYTVGAYKVAIMNPGAPSYR